MKTRKISALRIIILLIGLIYIGFLYVDIFSTKNFFVSNILKYISILLCFTISLLTGKDHIDKRDGRLLQSGLFITILADLYFLIIHDYRVGIALFCFVQIIYWNRYKGYDSIKPKFTVIKFATIFLPIISIHTLIHSIFIEIEFLYTIAFYYGICLLYATVEAVKVFKNRKYPYPNNYMILFGMILFLLCDASIALSILTKDFSISIHAVCSQLIWIFYLPSQVLLSLSGYQFKRSY